MNWKAIVVGIMLGVLTTGLVHLAGFGLMEGGSELVWGPEVVQRNLRLFQFFWPALMGLSICLCVSIVLDRLGASAAVRTSVLFPAIMVLAFLFPALQVIFRDANETIHKIYLCVLVVGFSTVWWIALARRGKPAP